MSEDVKIFVERIGPFFIPFALYFSYLALSRTWTPGPWTRHPWMLLTIAGLSLVVASFLLWRISSVEPTTGLYVAPHVVNGKIVPGYVRPTPGKNAPENKK